MAKIVLGKDITKLTQEEKNELMAEWRSRRNGNGRTGYRMPDAQIIRTNNFELGTNTKRKPGYLAKFYNEHVKCIFVCPRELYKASTAYGQTKIYYVGFLSDSNRFSFEEFRESPSRMVSEKFSGMKYRLEKYCQLFEKKNIDKNTYLVICMDGMSDADFMLCMLKFMRSFAGCPLEKASKTKILKKLISEYGVYNKTNLILQRAENYSEGRTYKVLADIHDFIFENNLCPWINSETRKNLETYSGPKRKSRILVELGLFYSILMNFAKIRRNIKATTTS